MTDRRIIGRNERGETIYYRAPWERSKHFFEFHGIATFFTVAIVGQILFFLILPGLGLYELPKRKDTGASTDYDYDNYRTRGYRR